MPCLGSGLALALTLTLTFTPSPSHPNPHPNPNQVPAWEELGVLLLLPGQGAGGSEEGAPLDGLVQGHAGTVHLQGALGTHRDFHGDVGRRHRGVRDEL